MILKIVNKFRLFEGESGLFEKLASDCVRYGEYGCGKSTRFMLVNTGTSIATVDNSLAWLNKISSSPRLKKVHVDLGPTGKWGVPLDFGYRAKFADYPMALWRDSDPSPDFVLIDGRFRVSCFLATLLCANAGTKILVDDYTDRSKFKVMEEFLPVTELSKRQALFIKPQKFSEGEIDLFKSELHRYSYVVD